MVKELLADRWSAELGTEFLVRWAGYGPEADTWEPTAHLGGRRGSLIREFRLQQATCDPLQQPEDEKMSNAECLAGEQFPHLPSNMRCDCGPV